MQQFLGQSPGKNSEDSAKKSSGKKSNRSSPKSPGKNSRQSDKFRVQSPQDRMSDAGGNDGLDGIMLDNVNGSFKNSQKEYKPGEAVNLEAVNLEDLDGA